MKASDVWGVVLRGGEVGKDGDETVSSDGQTEGYLFKICQEGGH